MNQWGTRIFGYALGVLHWPTLVMMGNRLNVLDKYILGDKLAGCWCLCTFWSLIRREEQEVESGIDCLVCGFCGVWQQKELKFDVHNAEDSSEHNACMMTKML